MSLRLPEDEARAVLRIAARAIVERKSRIPSPTAWRSSARPEQIRPPGDWRNWYVRGGRGGGKTWTGAHNAAELAETIIGEGAIIAPTYADARDKCVEGPSGILVALGTNRAEVERGRSAKVESWNRSLHDLRMRNGSTIWVDGADDGAPTIQGLNLSWAWCDEVGLWRKWQVAWEEALRYAVRIAPALIIATGTPKRAHPLVRLLMADERTVKTLLRTEDNATNLDPALVEELYRLYGGTALGRQELGGEMLTDVPGALVRREWIEEGRWSEKIPDMRRVVVAIDPEASSEEEAAETGIISAGVARMPADQHEPRDHDHYFVLDDVSLRATPAGWGKAAIAEYHKTKADLIVGEANNGGEMVEFVVRAAAAGSVNYRKVTASRGKETRAEPISALYERGLVHHVGFLSDLEDQWASWVPDGKSKSPDRLDACVWALTELSGGKEPGVLGFWRSQSEAKAAAQTR